MKLIVGVILSLALLELFHCAPLIGTFKDMRDSVSVGFDTGFNVGVGWLKNTFGVKFVAKKENGKTILEQTAPDYVPPNGTPNSSQRTIIENEENVQ